MVKVRDVIRLLEADGWYLPELEAATVNISIR
jgi:predicted RNA binding protein YcfA (HicA-like mRNA interferase family)